MNSFGKLFRITTWGESHGEAIGVVVDGTPPGITISEEMIQEELDKRKPGTSSVVSSRKESDTVKILSGIFKGKSTGAPISMIIENRDADSSVYEKRKNIFRPSHADYTYHHKYNGFNDYRGGGRASGRETACRVAAGAIAKKILQKEGITIIGYVQRIGSIVAQERDLEEALRNPIRCPDKSAAKKMIKKIEEIAKEGDSIGGLVKVIIKGCPVGLGEPVFDKIDAKIAQALFSIGAVKGVSIGAGFSVVGMKGSENNDQMTSEGFLSNNSGGIVGGITTGQEIIIDIAVKPTPSIEKKQKTINKSGKDQTLRLTGRHDPCLCPRLVPVAEAMLALVLTDFLFQQKSRTGFSC